MNVITYGPKEVFGVWLTVVKTACGQLILVNHKGTRKEAIQKALRAEPEPA